MSQPIRSALISVYYKDRLGPLVKLLSQHGVTMYSTGGTQQFIEEQGAAVTAREITMPPGARERFEESLLLFATGWQGLTLPSLQTLASQFTDALPVLHDIKQVAANLEDRFAVGDLAGVAACIGEQQRLKQLLPGNFVDDGVRSLVERVAAVGASAQLPGGKISGYLIVCCPDGQQQAVREALPELSEVPLRLTNEGSVGVRV